MADTVQIASTVLLTGQSTSVTLSPSGEKVVLRFSSTKRGTPSSLARLVVLDSIGRPKVTENIDDTGTEKVEIGSIDGDLSVSIECLSGSCTVSLTEETGVESVLPGSGGQIEADDIPDLSITEAKIVDAAVTTDKLGAAAAALTKIGLTGIKLIRTDGVGAAGAATLTGAAVGDRVLAVLGIISATGVSVAGSASFESVITVINQIQQIDVGDLQGNDYWVILIPAAA